MNKSICTVIENGIRCESVAIARGLCNKHRQRLAKYGDPLFTKQAPNGEPIKFFEAALRRETDECVEWPWSDSYGRINLGDRIESTHRLALERTVGLCPADKDIALHSCDNPPCINPRHLRWGTQSENCQEAVDKGRASRGERNGRALFTEDDVRRIRTDASAGLTGRDIAQREGCSRGAIDGIVSGRRWKHVQ